MFFKRLFIAIAIALLSFVAFSQDIPKAQPKSNWSHFVEHSPPDCQINGLKMTACKVKLVHKYNSPTFKVRVVKEGETQWDLTVRYITNSVASNICGQWKIVESDEDFTVAFVEYDEDFTVCILNEF